MPQLFRTTDVLSLAIEDDWVGPPNLVPNPTGLFGGFGWLGVQAVDESTLRLTGDLPDGPTTVHAETVPLPLPPGVPVEDVEVRIGATILATDGNVSLEAVYYDAAGVDLGHSPASVGTGLGYRETGSSLTGLPTAAWLALRISLDVPGGGGAGTVAVDFTGAIAVAGTFDDIIGAVLEVEPPYLELLHVATSVATERIPMDVATLNVSLVIDPDAPLRIHDGGPLLPVVDPDKIRKGKQVRLRAIVSDEAPVDDVTGLAFPTEFLYRGWVNDISTLYDVASKPRTIAKVTFAAVDVLTVLAGVTSPNGAELESLVALVLADAGVPYDVESATGPGPIESIPPVPVAITPEATAVDQVVITRDTNMAYAWVTAAGVLRFRTAFTLGDVVAAVMNEDFYNGGGPVIGYELTDVVNSLTVRFRYIDTGATVEQTLGPFEDLDSIRELGGRIPKEVTIQGVYEDWLPPDPTVVADLEASNLGIYARSVLAANSTTSKRITAVTAAVASLEDLAAAGPVHRDLYELVTAISAKAGLDQDSRITRVAHSITPGKWLVTYGLVDVGRVARHQRTRPLRATS